jgi:hypothetical protein
MKHLKEYDENLRKGMKSLGFKDPLPAYIDPDDFFEVTLDDDDYVDVSGPSVEMSIEGLISDFMERIESIPVNHRDSAKEAIKRFWIEKIESEFK